MSQRKIFLLFLLSVIFKNTNCFAQNQTASAFALSKSNKLSQVKIFSKSFLGLKRNYWLGFTQSNEALYVLDGGSEAECLWFNPRTKRTRRSASFSQYQANHLNLSTNGNILFATENAGVFNRPIDKIYYPNFFALDSRNLKRLKSFETGKRTNAYRPYPLATSDGRFAVPAFESTWDTKLKDFAGSYDIGARIEIWNWKTGKRERAIKYTHAPGMAEMLFSPTQRYICCVFMQDVPDKNDDIDRFADAGDAVVDVLDAGTGKTLWHIEEADHPIGYPFFFLSPTQFVAHNTLYDLRSKKSNPLFQPSKTETRLWCVGGVPGQFGRAFFQTKQGLRTVEYSDQPTSAPLA